MARLLEHGEDLPLGHEPAEHDHAGRAISEHGVNAGDVSEACGDLANAVTAGHSGDGDPDLVDGRLVRSR
jgi:hypothetical protein